MITIRPGSHVFWLMTMLSVVGEFPVSSLHLFGSARSWRDLVRRLDMVQDFRFPQPEEAYTCRMLNIANRGQLKTIRFYKGGLELLQKLDSEAYQYYLDSFSNHHFRGDIEHLERNHRVAEAVVMCMQAGIEVRPTRLAELQLEEKQSVLQDQAAMYLGRDLKKVLDTEVNKTMYSRMVGSIFYPGGCYAVYNSRNALMKWAGTAEMKVQLSLTNIGRLNGCSAEFDSAVIFGSSYDLALRILAAHSKERRFDLRFDLVYQHVHFVTLDPHGIELLKFLTTENWKEQLLDLLFEPENRSYNMGMFEYDAKVNDIYIFSYLDSDIARLIRFREAQSLHEFAYEILCYPEQVELLRSYMGTEAKLRTIELKQVLELVAPKRRSLFEE